MNIKYSGENTSKALIKKFFEFLAKKVSTVNGVKPDADGNVSWLPSLSDLASVQKGSWDGNTMPADVPNGISYVDGGGVDASSKGFPCNYATAVCFKLGQDRCFQMVAEKGGTGKTYTRTPQGNSSQGWNEWASLYNSANKPTASDVGARPDTWMPSLSDVAYLGINPIASTTDDTTANWVALGSGYAFYKTANLLADQPSQYGIVISYIAGTDVFQFWNTQENGPVYFRSGNIYGWGNSWTKLLDEKNWKDIVYPVGSIYLSVNSTSPASLFGGTWEQLKDRFLLGAGSSYTNGSTGGSATHTLTANEMPKHKHREVFDVGNNFVRPIAASASSAYTESTSVTDGTYKRITESFENASASSTTPFYPILTMEAGGGASHNNMPPYLTVYMWKRVS